MILTAQAIGAPAYKTLMTTATYTVHSCFHKGFNRVAEDGTLIFIGTDENGTFPFGVVVERYTRDILLKHVRVGQTIQARHGLLKVSDDCQLQCRIDVLPTAQDFACADIATLQALMNTYDFARYEGTDFDLTTMRQCVQALCEPQCDITSQLRYFIGRGQGLTPTGDDILTGILYVHHLTPFIHAKHIEALTTYLQTPVTTDVAQTFLKHALNGLFSSRITMLQYEATAARVNQLLQVGATSGWDTLYGIYAALNLRSESHG